MALTALSLAMCRTESGPARAARLFYTTLARAPLEATVMTGLVLPGSGTEEMVASFGSLEAWAGRVTKNGIMWRAEVVNERVENGWARLELVVLFNDGTRRRDKLGLVRVGNRWLVDMSSAVGFPRPTPPPPS